VIARGEIHVWIAEPPAIAGDAALRAAYDALMTDEERARQRRFVHERNRLESLVTRALARTTLSRYRDVAPEAWRFEANAYGRPAIAPPCGLAFNLSNHPTMVVCAVAEDLEVGVDVEPCSRGEEILGVAREVFTPLERAGLSALAARGDGSELVRAVKLWTLKEAYIKAHGMGFSMPLQEFAVDFGDGDDDDDGGDDGGGGGGGGGDGDGDGHGDAGERAPRLVFYPSRDAAPDWHVATFEVAGHRISTATRRAGGPPAIVVRTVTPLVDGSERTVATLG
jgi:4'-phosphopantetheinyl transferase